MFLCLMSNFDDIHSYVNKFSVFYAKKNLCKIKEVGKLVKPLQRNVLRLIIINEGCLRVACFYIRTHTCDGTHNG